MPVQRTYPGVYIQEISSGVRTITGVATSIGLFIGWAARGPTDRAARITSFADYDRQFGGLDLRTLLGYSVKQFFDNGGSDAYLIRLTHSSAKTASVFVNSDLTISASSPGEWANHYGVRIERLDNTHFRIRVLDHDNSDAIVQTFENLSMDVTNSRFIANIVNGRSEIITVTAKNVAVAPSDGTYDLKALAGDDGKVLEPNTSDFQAALDTKFGPGSITDRIDLFNIVCVPGLTDGAKFSNLQKLCNERRAFLLVDSVQDETVPNMTANGTANLVTSEARNSALYYPWVKQPDSLQQGAVRDFPPCGFVAGIYARTDATRGVWKAPAGSEASINGAVGLALTMSDPENGQLNPLGINCLRTMPVFGNVVWGARTLRGADQLADEWKYVPVRRTALFIEESLFRGTQWVVFEPNDEPLWAQIRLNIGAFMQDLFRQGAFQGQTPREAYFVKCDKETTTQNDINRGIVNILVGFAPLKPAEFVIITIQQMAGQLAT